jgi:HTH-type transcriptional regulator/antitoxin HigA
MDIRPIRTTADHEKALLEIQRLWNAKPGTTDADKLELLAMLVEAYEDAHYPMPDPDPVEAIKFRMEQQGLSRSDLVPIFGTRSRVS